MGQYEAAGNVKVKARVVAKAQKEQAVVVANPGVAWNWSNQIPILQQKRDGWYLAGVFIGTNPNIPVPAERRKEVAAALEKVGNFHGQYLSLIHI